MDPLSHILAQVRPQQSGWRVQEGRGDWTISFRPQPGVVIFGQCLEGAFEMARSDGRSLQVETGDFALMVAPPPWELRAGLGGDPIDFKALLADPARRLEGGDSVAATRFVSGYYKFDAAGAELLTRLMPPMVLIRPGEPAAGRLDALLALLRAEASTDQPGGAEVINRLLEVLLVEVLRYPGNGLETAGGSLLAGLADRKVSLALRRLHDAAERDWTVADLARAVGMSRSVFAARFAAVMGAGPMDYLASWRMTLAKRALLDRAAPLADVAELAGYRSVSAFSTAFRRRTGLSPTAYKAAAEAEAQVAA